MEAKNSHFKSRVAPNRGKQTDYVLYTVHASAG